MSFVPKYDVFIQILGFDAIHSSTGGVFLI